MSNKHIDPKVTSLINSVKPIDIRAELFRKGDFDFIVKGVDDNGKSFVHHKQKEALEILTSNKYSEFMFGGAANGAKVVENQGVILTPFGWKKGKDMKVGDLINNPDGSVQRIINIKPEIYLDKWNVYFSDGTMTSVGYDHLWKSWKGGKGRKIKGVRTFGEDSAEIVETHELKEWLDRGYTPQIPVCEDQPFNVCTKEKNRIDPYFLGVMLGNGCMTNKNSLSLSNNSLDYDHWSEQIGSTDGINLKKIPNTNSLSITFVGDYRKWLISKLDFHKLLGRYSTDKFIPKSYKWASIKDRYALVQGFMDTDGSSAKDKNACYYTSVSEELANDLAFVIRSLGGVVTITKKPAGYKDKNGDYVPCNDAYQLYIRHRNPDKLFRLKRKQHGIFSKNLVQKSVVDVRVEGKIRGRCITVSNPNGLYVTNDFIVTHNSWTGCVWLLFMCILYPRTKWFIARTQLKDLKQSVLDTFSKVCAMYGFSDFKFNGVDNYIVFGNRSKIIFKEVSYKPSDPMYEGLGSTEYTGGWIEESGEVDKLAMQVISKRAGRHLNDKDYKGRKRERPIKKMIFYTCNPKKNWNKTDFYDKWKTGTLESHKCFLPSLVMDNPFRESGSLEDLESYKHTNKVLYERLFKGNWDYEENPNALCDYEMIEQVFKNDHVTGGERYITADIARLGSDKAIIFVWEGWKVIDFKSYDLSKTTEISFAINLFRRKYQIPKNHVVVDADGVGGGVVDQVGCLEFNNNGKVFMEDGEIPNYRNLQVQCMYHLADKVNEGGLWIACDLNEDQKKEIKEELDQIQSKLSDFGKLDVKPKSEIKKDIGRSPDYRDALFLRVFFELNTKKITVYKTNQSLEELGIVW